MGFLHLAGPALLFAAAATAQSPLAWLEVRNPLPELLAATRTDSVRAVFDSLPVRRFLGDRSGQWLAQLRAQLYLAAPWFPERVQVVVPSRTGEAFGSLMHFFTAIVAYEASTRVSDQERSEGTELLHSIFPDSIRGLAGLQLVVRMEWERDRMAESVFERMTGGLAEGLATEAPFEELVEIDTTGDLCAIRFDLGAFLNAPGGIGFLWGLGVIADERDPFLEKIQVAARDLALELRIALDGERIEITVGPRGAPPDVPEIEGQTDGDSGAILRTTWSIASLLSGWERHEQFVEKLRQTPLAKYIPDWEEDYAALQAFVASLQRMSTSGRASVVASDEGLVLETESVRSGREVLLDETALLARIPDGVEFWCATGQSDAVELLGDLLAGTVDRADLRSMMTELRAEDGADARLDLYSTIRRQCLDWYHKLSEYEDDFQPGWALLVSAGGELYQPRVRIRAPAVAFIARPKSKNAGLSLARLWLEQVAGTVGTELDFGEDEMRLREWPDGWLGPRFWPHAFMLDDLLVVSTSAVLSERLRAIEKPDPEPSALISRFETSGHRLGDLCQWAASGIRGVVGLGGAMAYGEVIAEVLGLFGAIHSESMLRGDTIHSKTVLTYGEHERAEADALVGRVRGLLGLATLRADQMLVARGEGEYLGQEATFEFSYGPQGEFRERVHADTSLDLAYAGDVVYEDTGWGPIRHDSIGGGAGRAWAAGVSGQWMIPGIGFATRVGERTREEITIRFRTEDDAVDRRITLDAVSLLPRSFDFLATTPRSVSRPTFLFDYRKIDGRMLPHRVVTPEGNEYRIESWTTVPLDPARFAGRHAPRFHFVRGADPLIPEVAEGWIVTRGTIAGEEGLVALRPLSEGHWVDESVIRDQPSQAGEAVELEDIRIGPLRAERFAFRPTRLPEFRGEQVLAMVGTEALQGCCVRFRFSDHRTEILAPGSFDGEGFWPMTGVFGHRVFRCRLRGDVMSWCAPIAMGESIALVKASAARELDALSRAGGGPFRNGQQLEFVELAGFRAVPDRTTVLSVAEPMGSDTTPIALSSETLGEMSIEMDFPNARYRLVR